MDDDHRKNQVGEGKLWIKLKINPIKFEEEDEEAEENQMIGPQRNNQPRVCNICNKGFSSGKALGGHMRVHVQANKELLLKKEKNSSTYGNDADGNEKPTCSICEKEFPSMKSLFGHMRCHPEREWRGMKGKNSSGSSSVSNPKYSKLGNQIENSVMDLTGFLPSWSVTAKRGRKALTTEEEKLFGAVNDLMRLARGDSFESGLTHKNNNMVEGCDYEATNSNSMTNKPEIGSKKKLRMDGTGPTDVKKQDEGRGKAVLETGYVREKSARYHDCDDFTDDDESGGEKLGGSNDSVPSEEELIVNYRYCESTNTKKRKKQLKLREIIAADEIHQKYKCNTCDKFFPTHQALGGHRSSHNKLRVNSNPNIDESSSFAAGEEDELQLAEPMSQPDEAKLAAESNHQCKICSKVFPTGQALGGHKRCHWTGPADQAAVSSQAAASPGEASQTGQKVLGFDLNELPAMEDEEDGYGYFASNSSHTSVA